MRAVIRHLPAARIERRPGLGVARVGTFAIIPERDLAPLHLDEPPGVGARVVRPQRVVDAVGFGPDHARVRVERRVVVEEGAAEPAADGGLAARQRIAGELRRPEERRVDRARHVEGRVQGQPVQRRRVVYRDAVVEGVVAAGEEEAVTDDGGLEEVIRC